MNVFDKGLITILICNGIFSILSIPLILRKVSRNSIYGYRTGATLNDDKVWYEANAYFGRRFLTACILSACIAILLHQWYGISHDIYIGASIVLLTAPVVFSALLTARFVRKMGAAHRSSGATS